jgi:hypothetical protein
MNTDKNLVAVVELFKICANLWQKYRLWNTL